MGDFPYSFPESLVSSSSSSSTRGSSTPKNENDTVFYDGPTLFVRGMQSRYVSDDKLPAIRHFFPKAKIEDVDAGHWLISEKPEDFRSIVINWFGESGVE